MIMIDDNWVIFNVGGICYEIYKVILKKILVMCFFWLIEVLVNYDFIFNEYFFDCYFGVFV